MSVWKLPYAGVSRKAEHPLKDNRKMKKYCKNIDITDRKLISNAVYECLEGKYARNDTCIMFSYYSHIPPEYIKALVKSEGKKSVRPIVESVIDGIQMEIINKSLVFPPIWYKDKVDTSCLKVRKIGIQNVKQQLYDYIAVEGLKPFLCRIGEYQCAAIKGKGQSYGIRAIKRWMRNPSIRYAGKCDIKKCYPSINPEKLMEFLKIHIKNDNLLWLIETLINTFDAGLSIGSYLSQYLCNLYLSQLYHYIAEDLFKIRKKRRGGNERINLVRHVLFYMDDVLILGSNAKDLHKAMKMIISKAEEMGLEIKPGWVVYKTIGKREDDGKFVDMMGVRIYRHHTTIRRRVFLRVRRAYKTAQKCIKIKSSIPLWLARRCIAYYGILKNTDSYKIREKYNVRNIIKKCKEVIRNESKILRTAATC